MTIERRRSDRLMVTIPLRVIGEDENGVPFDREAQTIDVSRHGARIRISHPLNSGQELRIINQLNRREAAFRVAGPLVPLTAEGGEFALTGPLSATLERRSQWGMECLDLTIDLWGIRFPPATADQNSDPKALLACRACKLTELVHLTLGAVDVLGTAGILTRFCPGCKRDTPWGYAPNEPADPPLPAQDAGTEAAPAASPRERRTYRRVVLQLPTLIRDYFGGIEITKSENLSKGGICFVSEKLYQIGEGIMVACPYDKESHNIEVPAQIMSCQQLEGTQRKIYGIQYKSKSE